ncbi:DUF7524 family protein [Natronobeatus ordinarius]|uniref:DUF7524 family protein n=1 Tax=Natronobeatus ordinarius TaxID=2963433 RepID=UPI0020CEFB4B|nr:hypothetical protein [Natronobeatus ordinarius]
MPGEELTVSVGRDGPDTITVDSESLETQASFGVVLESHSRPVHVHCRLGGALARIATLDRSNYYVDTTEETFVPVVVGDVSEPVEGTLELSTGYGATSVTIDVTVTPGPPSVEVDESLARPPREPDEPNASAAGERLSQSVVERSFDAGALGVLVLALLAIGLAAATAAVVGGAVAFVAFLVVVAGVAVAAFLLVR